MKCYKCSCETEYTHTVNGYDHFTCLKCGRLFAVNIVSGETIEFQFNPFIGVKDREIVIIPEAIDLSKSNIRTKGLPKIMEDEMIGV